MTERIRNLQARCWLRANAADDGFTLLETLVALTILGLSVSVLFAIFSGGIARAREDGIDMHARVLAQGLLVAAQAQPTLSGSTGASSGYRWEVKVDPEIGGIQASLIPERVSATVRWNSGAYDRLVTLSTVVLVPEEKSR